MPEPPMMPSTDAVMAMRYPLRRLGGLAGRLIARVDVVPELLLGEVEQARHDHEIDQHLEADTLALVELRLGRPPQEGGDVLGVLIDRLRRAVGIAHDAVAQR